MESRLKCFAVKCLVPADGSTVEVGVMAADFEKAMLAAVKSLREGRHIDAVAVQADETDRI